jgi:hypothetical protein
MCWFRNLYSEQQLKVTSKGQSHQHGFLKGRRLSHRQGLREVQDLALFLS